MVVKCHVAVAIVIDGALTCEQNQLTDRVVCQQWAESRVHELHKAIPCRRPAIELQTVVP
jgi:hypothetical protein